MKVEYQNFTIEASCEKFNPELYYKVALWVSSPKMDFDLCIFPGECSAVLVEDLLGGDEEKAKASLFCVIINREAELANLRRLLP